MKPFSGPNYSENQKKCHGSQLPCAYCGKPINNMKTAVMIFICCDEFEPAGGEAAHAKHDNNMGGYPLGPDCARKYRRYTKINSVRRSNVLKTTLESNLPNAGPIYI